jgi:hypothetical protein
MREVILVGSYCDTEVKLKALENLLDAAKSMDIPVIAFGRWPIPERIQEKCAYWIYDQSNPVLSERTLDHWFRINGEQLSNYFFDFGYAALEQIVKTLGFAKNLHYDIAYWLNYDVDMASFEKFREVTSAAIINNRREVACTKFKPISTQPLRGINTTSIAFKINPAYEKLRGVLSKSFYRKCAEPNEDYIAEDFIEECFNVAEVDYEIMPIEFFPNALLTSTGSRKHGQIPEDLVKLTNYLNSFFVGFEQSTEKAVCYIWNMKKPVSKMLIDFGFDEPFELNIENSPIVRLTLEKRPKLCKILRIDDNTIDEYLDREYSDRYWEMNKIKSLI